MHSARDLDYRYARECPRCGTEAGWTGRTEPWEGRPALELACPHCGYLFIHWSGRWEAEFQSAPPEWVRGRDVPSGLLEE